MPHPYSRLTSVVLGRYLVPHCALASCACEDRLLRRRSASISKASSDTRLVLEPLLFSVLHRATVSIPDDTAGARLTLFQLDDASRCAADSRLLARQCCR